MKIFDKMKTIFWDSEEDDDEVENIKPKRQDRSEKIVKEKETINERDVFKSETSFKFPVVFTEEDFAKTIPPEKTVKEEKEQPRPYRENVVDKQPIKKQEKPKTFTLSPAISPVYGLVDKSSKVEMPKQKTEQKIQRKNDEISFENVRKKAYGTLSDDIEKTLDHSNIVSSIKKEENDDIEEIVNPNKNITMEEAIENYDDYGMIYSTDNKKEEDIIKIKRDKKDVLEDTIEQDLFNLIDSMYDKEDKGEDK